jgi:hypothetical protein
MANNVSAQWRNENEMSIINIEIISMALNNENISIMAA